MNPGKLRHRIGLQRSVTVTDDFGGASQTWDTYATVWGDVQETGGKKYMQGDRLKAQRFGKATLRYYAGLTINHRLLFDGRALNINSLTNPDGKRIEHQIEWIEELSTTDED